MSETLYSVTAHNAKLQFNNVKGLTWGLLMQENVLVLPEWYNYIIIALSVWSLYLSATSVISALFDLLYTKSRNCESHRNTITWANFPH